MKVEKLEKCGIFVKFNDFGLFLSFEPTSR
jgi:hypothetical protein